MKQLKNKNGEYRIENLKIRFTLYERRLTLFSREAL